MPKYIDLADALQARPDRIDEKRDDPTLALAAHWWNKAITAYEENLRSLTTYDSEMTMRGKWVYNSPEDNIPYCSECLMPQDMETNYCHSCGAKMEES